ncbi:ATP-dependent Clp protease adaptor ClpS [Nitratifractor sp.]
MPKTVETPRSETELREPPLYRVILHNDDYTTMDFVVEVLRSIFHKSPEEAETIMWTVHKQGRAVCGVYTFEIAQTKAEQVKRMARANEFPLLATIEQDE